MGSTTRVEAGEKGSQRHLIALSAKTEGALRRKVADLLDWLAIEQPQPELGDIAYTLWRRRTHYAVRTAFLVRDLFDLQQQLRAASRADRLINAERMTFGTDPLAHWVERYLAGGEVDFEALYGDIRYRRLDLPTYPFVAERFWIPEQVDTATDAGQEHLVDRLHPLLGRNTSSFHEQRFTTRFTGSEFFLQDHVVVGQRMLPGVACLEMGRAAAELSGADRIGQIENIVWTRPILAESGQDVHFSLFPSDDHGDAIEFELWTEGGQDESVLHAQGLIRSTPAREFERIDLDAVRRRCAQRVEAQGYYQTLKNLGLEYGPGMQSIRELYQGSRESLARLELPTDLHTGFSAYDLHPSLLDGALQAAVVLMQHVQAGQGSVCLPYALAEVQIIRSLPTTCYAYVKGVDDTGLKYDVFLVEDAGQVLVALKGLSVRPFRTSKGVQATVDRAHKLDLLEKLSRGELSIHDVEQVLGG